MPDGCIDLQWIDGALRVAGPDREPVVESVPAGATVVGLRFQPGAATAWLGVPASELVNRRVPLEAFWGIEARTLADWASEGRSPEGVARRLESALARRGASVRPADAAWSTVYRALSANHHLDGRIVDWLAHQLGLSHRTLRRRCHEAFGYGPKTLDRILRFQRFMRLARAAGPEGAATLAAKAGYADQAHLTRETRRLAGLTPTTIREQLSS